MANTLWCRDGVVSLWSVLLLTIGAGVSGCFRVSDLLEAPAPEGDFFESCDIAPDPELPAGPARCAGPDDNGWSNQERPDGAGACPAPPPGGCTRVVLGRLSDTGKYINCPGYVVLSRSDWTIGLNDNFIACVAACELGNCDPPVIVVSDRSEIPDFHEDYTMTTVTSRELCELHNAGCEVVMADQTGPGLVDCACPLGSP